LFAVCRFTFAVCRLPFCRLPFYVFVYFRGLDPILMRHRILTIYLSVVSITAFAQSKPDKDRQLVLQRNKPGKTYVFDRSKKGHYNRRELTYLGKLKTNDGRVFKILTSIAFSGSSPKATSRILLFNNKNQYTGNYYVGMIDDLPGKIENNALVFDNKKRVNCDPALVTRIPFNNGMPKQLFVPCRNNKGDIYSFSED
jgi:hypothetical protein